MSKLKRIVFMYERKLSIAVLMALFLSLFFAANVSAIEYEYAIFWKDYNGQDLGGYMPDIDQRQDFDYIARYEQNENAVFYQGGWSLLTDSNASGGSITYSGNEQASCGFTFTGTSIRYIGTPSNNKGIASVQVDNDPAVDVDLYSPTLKYKQVLYTNTSLSPGQHTIKIVVTGRKNESASGHLIDVDAFDVDGHIESHYCAPVAEANSLWWLDKKHNEIEIFANPLDGTGYIGGDINHDGASNLLDLVQELAWLMDTNGQRTGIYHVGTYPIDEQRGIDAVLEKYDIPSYERTIDKPELADVETNVRISNDVKLDLGFWHVESVDKVKEDFWRVVWKRVGGHAVTVAGVGKRIECSISKKPCTITSDCLPDGGICAPTTPVLAISDPYFDHAETGTCSLKNVPCINDAQCAAVGGGICIKNAGIVRPEPGGHLPHPNNHIIHNIEANASHDFYPVGLSPSPGGKYMLKNYPVQWPDNFPPEFETNNGSPVPTTIVEYLNEEPPLQPSMTFAEIEAAVVVFPIVCGNGFIDPGEQCDDGNANNGDGCSATCQLDGAMLVKPNGGEVIPSGSTYEIDWIASLTAAKFDLAFSLDDGASWNKLTSICAKDKTIACSIDADCGLKGPCIKKVTGSSYNWQVPKPKNNNKKCLVKVKAYNASDVLLSTDISDQNFTIEVVRVTSPTTGDKLISGSTSPIAWLTNATKSPVKGVELKVRCLGGPPWTLIDTIVGNPGYYLWMVPSMPAPKKCQIGMILYGGSPLTPIGSDIGEAFQILLPPSP